MDEVLSVFQIVRIAYLILPMVGEDGLVDKAMFDQEPDRSPLALVSSLRWSEAL